jgi:hypothetical protein
LTRAIKKKGKDKDALNSGNNKERYSMCEFRKRNCSPWRVCLDSLHEYKMVFDND